MELLDRETFLEWMERIMTRFDDLKQTTADIVLLLLFIYLSV